MKPPDQPSRSESSRATSGAEARLVARHDPRARREASHASRRHALGRSAGAAVLVLAVTSVAGCALLHRKPPAVAPQVSAIHYVVGAPYQAGGVWRYPRESFEGVQTGLAEPMAGDTRLTTDGEVFDATALTGAHPTLQLPSIVEVTNLDTGRQVAVRVNDRGPVNPGRLLALTPRVFDLLGAAGQSTMRVRMRVRDGESRQLALSLRQDEAGPLPIAAAPRDTVIADQLPPPDGTSAAPVRSVPATPPAAAAPRLAAVPPLRLPETVTQVAVTPTALYVTCGEFSRLQYAELLRARIAFLGATTTTNYTAPRDRAYQVRIGPLPDVASADTVLDRVLRAGVTDARIVAD